MGFQGDPNDIIIAIVGPTGSGKTRFIEALSGRAAGGGSSLKTHTKRVTPHVISYNGSAQQISGRLVLVDTPGLNQGSGLDAMSLRDTFDKLKAKYSKAGLALQLAGIIYLHPITTNRLSDSSICKKPRLICHLGCGTPLNQARLITTMWDRLNPGAVEEDRERELTEYWTGEGAATGRFNNTPNGAWEIVADLLTQSGQAIQHRRPTEMEVAAYDDVPRCFGFC